MKALERVMVDTSRGRSTTSVEDTRWIQVPSLLRIRETRDDLLEDISDLDSALPLVVTGNTSAEILGDPVARVISESEALRVEGHAFSEVKRVVVACLDHGSDLIVGVGGGRVIDVAKLAAAKLGIPFVSVPTQVSHDGLCSPVAVIQRVEEERTESLGANTPTGVFVAREVLLGAPVHSLRAGLGDLVSNLSATKDWLLAAEELGEEIDDYAYLIANLAANSVYHHDLVSDDLERLLDPLIKGLVLSGIAMSIAGSSRPCSGAEHEISHALDALFPGRAPHGLQVALGTVYAEHLRGETDLENLLTFYAAAQLPMSHAALGFSEQEMVEAILHAPSTRPDRWTILEKKDLSESEALDLVRSVARRADAVAGG